MGITLSKRVVLALEIRIGMLAANASVSMNVFALTVRRRRERRFLHQLRHDRLSASRQSD
jgi:hypothetical protein